MLSRTRLLLGDNNMTKLHDANVIVFGVGGVGGYVCEILARSGVGHITIVDFDKVDVTNINRQIIATTDTVGMFKVDAMKSRLHSINPNIDVTAINTKYCSSTYEDFDLTKYDYVIDAIDIVTDKIHLIATCYNQNIKCVSAMGAGNRKGIPTFKVADIYKTYNDGLAKVLRKKLRENGVMHYDVVFTSDDRVNINGDTVGSIAYYPAMCGCVLAGFVINQLTE